VNSVWTSTPSPTEPPFGRELKVCGTRSRFSHPSHAIWRAGLIIQRRGDSAWILEGEGTAGGEIRNLNVETRRKGQGNRR